MRELGQSQKALELLSLVVSCKDPVIVSNEEDVLTKAPTSTPNRFLPPEPKKSKTSRRKDEMLQSSARCLWLMATLSLEESPNDSGRNKAFDLFHAASIRLQDTTNRTECIPFLAMIEDEAEQIAEHVFE